MVANSTSTRPGGQRGNAVGDLERHELDGNAEILAVQLADIGVEAFLLAGWN